VELFGWYQLPSRVLYCRTSQSCCFYFCHRQHSIVCLSSFYLRNVKPDSEDREVGSRRAKEVTVIWQDNEQNHFTSCNLGKPVPPELEITGPQ
jgi:hypothetical protein